MKVCGVIAEYNPFHKGHEYQLNKIRQELNADYIIVVMSGDFVQRGEPALIEKHLRAETALRCGADLVLELPVYWCTGSAETFASGGVRLLNSLGVVTHLCFGVENDSSLLSRIADLLAEEPSDYKTLLKKRLAEGVSMARAREESVLTFLGDHPKAESINRTTENKDALSILREPNNILAIEYLKAIRRQNSTIIPWPILRQGGSYKSTMLKPETYIGLHSGDFASIKASGNFASALAIRKAIRDGKIDSVLPFVPESAQDMLVAAYRGKRFLLADDLDMVLFYALLSAETEELTDCAGISDEMKSRIFRLLNQYKGFEEYTALCSSKTVPKSQTRRTLLHILLKTRIVSPEALYARILGFRKDAAGLLTEIHRAASIPVISKLAYSKNLLSDQQAAALSDTVHASNLYDAFISHKSNKPFKNEYTKPIIIF